MLILTLFHLNQQNYTTFYSFHKLMWKIQFKREKVSLATWAIFWFTTTCLDYNFYILFHSSIAKARHCPGWTSSWSGPATDFLWSSADSCQVVTLQNSQEISTLLTSKAKIPFCSILSFFVFIYSIYYSFVWDENARVNYNLI